MSEIAPTRSACLVAAFAGLIAPAAATPVRWRIDPARTEIAFSIDAVGFPRTEGRFRRFDGKIAVDFDDPAKSSVAFHVLTASVDVGSASFSDYVRSPAFLDAERRPSIDFVSTSVTRTSASTVRVAGDLTLHGVTKPLTVDVAVAPADGGRRLDFHAETRIDRLAFGMNSGFPLVARDVDLVISSEAAAP